MHIFFSGIGGAGLAPGALIAKDAGYEVSGSDQEKSQYTDYLKKKGINVFIGQDGRDLAKLQSEKPIDLFVYTLALPKGHPEMAYCEQNHIKTARIFDFIQDFVTQKRLKMIAVAGTHGKTTTTAMTVWLFKQLGIPVSYSVGAKVSFGEMGEYDPNSEYFVHEADEFGKKFLSFYPATSLISGIDWDHPDIFPTREVYNKAFTKFIGQSQRTVIWQDDINKLGLNAGENLSVLDNMDPRIEQQLKLAGRVNRLDAWLVASGMQAIFSQPFDELVDKLNEFPGVSRRFEKISENVYTDYAHTPAKIRGALQLAREVAGNNIVIVYEGLHNTRQHFIKDELANLFDDLKQLYIVPTYLARENKELELLTPDKILDLLSNPSKARGAAAKLDDDLAAKIRQHAKDGDLVLCFSAGSAGSLDEWLRHNFSA